MDCMQYCPSGTYYNVLHRTTSRALFMKAQPRHADRHTRDDCKQISCTIMYISYAINTATHAVYLEQQVNVVYRSSGSYQQ